jgi:DNA polymerase V
MSKKEKETGFPSPAQGYEGKTLDFNRILIKNPPATYIMEAAASGMEWRGIFPGSLLVVDRSLKPAAGSVAIAACDGNFICRAVEIRNGRLCLTDGNKTISPDGAPSGGEVSLFGIVRAVVTFL